MHAAIQFPERLRNERLRVGTPRAVDYSPGFCDRSGLVGVGSKAAGDLATLIYLLGQGSPIPDRFYRNFVGDGNDRLLEDQGIKHLHLGGATSNILLFLVEYEEKVLLLEINNHNAFAEQPVGSTLHRLHCSALASEDKVARMAAAFAAAKKAAERTPEAIGAKKAALKAALRNRKPKPPTGA